MKWLAAAWALALTASLSSCGNTDPYARNRRHVRECIAVGGTPQYTQSPSGNIVDWLGCVMP